MESDRMGHLLGVIDTAKVNEQRGVVQNEKRQGENQPYGKVNLLMAEGAYPAGHPYSWTVIGSMEDLNAASVEDVKQWFRTYYGPNNAVIVLAGDITPETARQKVEQYFGDIPATPPIAKQETWIAPRTGSHREIMQDRVPQARIYTEWNIPEYGSADADYLDLVTDVLAAGKTSRLYKRLVDDEQSATDVAAYVDLREIGGQLVIRATAKPAGDLARVERAIDEELARFVQTGPTASELRRVKTQSRATFIRGVERIGGFGGKSDVLARNEVFTGSADHYLVTQRRIAAATAGDLKSAATRWLRDGEWVLEVHPYPTFETSASGADRTKLPDAGTPPDARFPAIARAALPNGLKIVLAERHSIPQVQLTLLVDVGHDARRSGALPPHLVQAESCDAGDRRRCVDGGDPAEAHAPVQQLAVRRCAAEEREHGRRSAAVTRLHSRSPRSGAVDHFRRRSRAAEGQSARVRDRGYDVTPGRAIHVPCQHESARSETLVVRRVHIGLGCARPAAVHRVRAGADRQDQGVDDRGRRGAARHSRAEARNRGRARQGAGESDPDTARQLGDDGRRAGVARAAGDVRAGRSLLRDVCAARAGVDDSRRCGRGAGSDPSRSSGVGGRGRSGEDRSGDPRAELRGNPLPRRRRQAVGGAVVLTP